jgi:hypothetical protein
MFIDKDTISSIEMMTEEERQDPSLVKNREDYKNSPISVYYGSAKPELTHTCLNCKKHGTCADALGVERQGKWLKENVNNPFVTAGMNTEEIKKLKQNVFIIINCKFKEK